MSDPGRNLEGAPRLNRRLSTLCMALGVLTAPAWAAAPATQAPPPSVVCHVDYGGEVRHITAPAVDSPYAVAPVEVGSYFLFRVVHQTRPADLASFKVYVLANHEAGAQVVSTILYDGKPEYYAIMVTHPKSGISSVKDLKGRNWQPTLPSSPGHLTKSEVDGSIGRYVPEPRK